MHARRSSDVTTFIIFWNTKSWMRLDSPLD
jgi:hypothetical protein